MEDFLRNRKQRVVLNGQTSNWENIHAGVPQGSNLGLLLFLIYINDLAENLSSNPKLFADDASLFSVVRDLNTSANEVADDLKKTEAWTSMENEFQPRSFEAGTRSYILTEKK